MPSTGSLRRFTDKVAASIRGTGAGAGRRRDVPADPDLAGTDGVLVSYAPNHDGDADPGEVVWTWVPFEDDPSQGKDRPVLILGTEGELLVGVQLSSKDHAHRDDASEWLPVGRGSWDPEHRVSYADASRLLRIVPTEVRREGAALQQDRFDEVLARVRSLHGWS